MGDRGWVSGWEKSLDWIIEFYDFVTTICGFTLVKVVIDLILNNFRKLPQRCDT